MKVNFSIVNLYKKWKTEDSKEPVKFESIDTVQLTDTEKLRRSVERFEDKKRGIKQDEK